MGYENRSPTLSNHGLGHTDPTDLTHIDSSTCVWSDTYVTNHYPLNIFLLIVVSFYRPFKNNK